VKHLGKCDNCSASDVEVHPVAVPLGPDTSDREWLQMCDACDLFGDAA
jgi:hypothetical protein